MTLPERKPVRAISAKGKKEEKNPRALPGPLVHLSPIPLNLGPPFVPALFDQEIEILARITIRSAGSAANTRDFRRERRKKVKTEAGLRS